MSRVAATLSSITARAGKALDDISDHKSLASQRTVQCCPYFAVQTLNAGGDFKFSLFLRMIKLWMERNGRGNCLQMMDTELFDFKGNVKAISKNQMELAHLH